MMYPASSSNVNGKRPSSSNNMDSRKKARKDDESETQSPAAEKEEVKAKPTRGSRFVLVFLYLDGILTIFSVLARFAGVWKWNAWVQNKGLHASDAHLAIMNVYSKNPIVGKGLPSKSLFSSL
jgi:hypothetical protein